MSETQIKIITDVIKMTPKINLKALMNIRDLMENEIDNELLKIEPTVNLENMDVTEKVMYLEYLTESKRTKEKEEKDTLSLEEILKREGLSVDDLYNKN